MRYVLAALIAVLLATPVSASLQIVDIYNNVGDPTDIMNPENIPAYPFNDFANTLTASPLNLVKVVVGNVMVSGPGTLYFYAHGSESGFTNTFSVGPLTYTESSDINPWNPDGIPITSLDTLTTSIFVSGPTLLSAIGLDARFTTTGTPPSGKNAKITEGGFGIFAKYESGSIVTDGYSELYFGYDDNGADRDDNHDDLIVRVLFVPSSVDGSLETPEPVSAVVWGLLAAAAMVVPGVARRR
jgi:hypothetical protein